MPDKIPDLLSVIKGSPQKFWDRWPDTEKHLKQLRMEFAGKREASYEVVRQIVYLRRNIDTEKSWANFTKLVKVHIGLYTEELNTRWLVSICDTYADYGSPIERSNAILISAVVNLTKLGETIRLVSVNPELDQGKIQRQKRLPLWDGMNTFSIKNGDMPRNLFKRISAALKETPVLEKIWQCIYARLQTSDTALKRLNDLHRRGGIFHPAASKSTIQIKAS